METTQKITCQKCKKMYLPNQFYTCRDGSPSKLCKKCMTMHMDAFDKETFLWALKDLDIPYVENEWNVLRDRAFQRDPLKANASAIFGKYCAKMKLKKWQGYTWADSEKLAQESGSNRTEEQIQKDKEFQEELKQKHDAGEISDAEYEAYVDISEEKEAHDQEMLESLASEEARQKAIGESNQYNENDYMDQSELPDLAAELTQEDKMYLAVKWGTAYTAAEWVTLEKKYKEMEVSFPFDDSDTDGALILICKTYLKMNQALDSNDLDSYSKLSRTFEAMRKSAKFTAAQNKQEHKDFLSAVGEIVKYCEEKGGAIPRYKTDVDYDIVDTIIKDMKSYDKSLIYQDVTLSRQIEDFIKKRTLQMESKAEKKAAREAPVVNGGGYAWQEIERERKKKALIDSLETFVVNRGIVRK